MPKNEVRLEPQERFDLIDARALQTLTYNYMGEALGNLMGWGGGLLTPFDHVIDSPNNHIELTSEFAIYVTTEEEDNAFKGEVAVYQVSAAQAQRTVDYTAALAASVIWYGLTPEQILETYGSGWTNKDANDYIAPMSNEGPLGSGAFPILWAMPTRVEISQDARRAWSVELQTEVPISILTRISTGLVFEFSSSIQGPDAALDWVPIARVVGWANNEPRLAPISVWDNYSWFVRAFQGGQDFDGDAITDGFWSSKDGQRTIASSAGLLSGNSTLANPQVSPWYPFLTDGRGVWADQMDQRARFVGYRFSAENPLVTQTYEGSAGWEGALNAIHTIAADPPEDWTFIHGTGTNSQEARPWNRSGFGSASGGLVDVVNSLKTTIHNLLCGGVWDYGTEASARDTYAAPWNNARVSETPLGAPTAQWHAKPIRSINSLAVENVFFRNVIEGLETQIAATQSILERFESRIYDLETAQDPFAGVSINDAQPLIPALALTFYPRYSATGGYFSYTAGPENAVQDVFIFCSYKADYGSNNEGYVGIKLSPETRELVGADLRTGRCVIQAQPIHYENSSPWLMPEGPHNVGKIKNAEGWYWGNTASTIVGPKASTEFADTQTKTQGSAVLQAYANYMHCTLNVVVPKDRTVGVGVANYGGEDLRIYPVTSVPDIVKSGDDLRGYPHWENWQDAVMQTSEWNALGGYADVFHDPGATPVSMLFGSASRAWDYSRPGVVGDTTNPEYLRLEGEMGISKEQIWGLYDDLRGAAHTITFLRPDRFAWYQDGNTFNVGSPTVMNAVSTSSNASTSGGFSTTDYDSPNATWAPGGNAFIDENDDAYADATSGGTMDPRNAASVSNPTLAQGRFFPAFSLLVYKPSFSSLGQGDVAGISIRIDPLASTSPDGAAAPVPLLTPSQGPFTHSRVRGFLSSRANVPPDLAKLILDEGYFGNRYR